MKVAFRSSEVAFFKESFILASGKQFFRLVQMDFLSNASFWRVETDFLLSVHLFRANFLPVETTIQIKVKPFFYRVTSLLLLEAIFYMFFLDILTGESSFFAQWKRIFLTNFSFWLVESDFLPVGNSFFLFTAFFLLVETIISSKLRFHQPKIRISLKNTFPVEGKRIQKMISTSQKKQLPISRNELFLSKLLSSYSNNGFCLVKQH